MPVLEFEIQKVNFAILEDNDPKTITLVDKSTYFGTPELPLIAVTLPGYTGSVEFAYIPNAVITIDSYKLGLSYGSDNNCMVNLPDGVYQITMKFCPYEEFNQKRCYLKTSTLQLDFERFLLKIGDRCTCIDTKALKDQLIDFEILLLSAKAEVAVCNIDKAVTKYKAAVKLLANLNKKLNC